MQSAKGRRVQPRGFVACRLPSGVALLLLGLATAGCTLNGKPTASLATRGTVAFDSIDGPPIGVFQKLVQNLNEEAERRQLAVVSRDDASQYRVRGYLAAHVKGKNTSIAWVWDVYDADQRRALRIVGQELGKGEPSSGGTRDAWAAADDQVLQRIAKDGMNQFVAFLNSPEVPRQEPTLAPAPGEDRVYGVAHAKDSPESMGIFPVIRTAVSAPEEEAELPGQDEIPLPRTRPATAALLPAGILAYAESRP
jgi:hypothetical protein